MLSWLKKSWSENKGFLIFIVLMIVFRSSLADWNTVPTGSMKPNMIEGDRILINKLAYDLRLPLSKHKVAKFSDPVRGDIIIFDSKVSGKRLVKRVIGMPGDVISMRNNVLTINGKTLQYKTMSRTNGKVDLVEDLFGLKYPIRITQLPTKASTFAATLVPNDVYLALGDNRDNSADSRFIGFIPRNEIIGRSRYVVMSLDYNDYYLPRMERFLKPL